MEILENNLGMRNMLVLYCQQGSQLASVLEAEILTHLEVERGIHSRSSNKFNMVMMATSLIAVNLK